MDFYKVHEGCEVWRDGELLAKGGEVFPLATDSDVKADRKIAQGFLVENRASVFKVDGPAEPAPAKKKASKKKKPGSYATREMKADE